MKEKNHKAPDLWEHTMRLPKFMAWSVAILSTLYILYTIQFLYSPYSCNPQKPHEFSKTTTTTAKPYQIAPQTSLKNPKPSPENTDTTTLEHVVFGIAASSKLWNHRKRYVKYWWKPNVTRGVVWLDSPVQNDTEENKLLPQLRISSNTSSFTYKNPKGHRSAIRLSRIVSETLRLGMENVRWFVMGDDDTVFVTDNLIRVLSKYDHNQYYYIGSPSESHLQNLYFSYNMAYGGGGFAISYPLAKALEKMQDRCIRRYPNLYGSDDRIQACMAEIGVPLTIEKGFHQNDVYGSLFGLLAAHPVAPLVSLHHLDLVETIFPNANQLQALRRLKVAMNLDSAGLMQQSICYDKTRSWTVSVSWGYTVQILRGIHSPRDMEMPTRTFLNWYKRSDYTGFAFNTRPVSRNPCQKPFVYFLSNALYNKNKNETASEYARHQASSPDCKWKIADPSRIHKVLVYKKPDSFMWDKAPRRNCCRILPTKKKFTMEINVGECKEEEFLELR